MIHENSLLLIICERYRHTPIITGRSLPWNPADLNPNLKFICKELHDSLPCLILEKHKICMVCSVQRKKCYVTSSLLQYIIQLFTLGKRHCTVLRSMYDQKWWCRWCHSGDCFTASSLFVITLYPRSCDSGDMAAFTTSS